MRRSRLPLWEWGVLVAVLLVTWGVRVVHPAEVPPGWRDDELINILALTGEVLAGRPTLYFTGASGHEPLYHTLHAGVLALVGMNPMGAHLLSMACGLLTVPLAYVLIRRLFGRPTALLAVALLATSFWSLMYSRAAIRHAMVLPPALAAFYLLWSRRQSRRARRWLPIAAGLLLAAALYTYTVARLLPFILLAFGFYLALFHRKQFRRWWRPLLVALAVAAVVTVPLWIAIARGQSEAAAQGIGADARIAELSVPLRELQSGNPRPLLENIFATLGMFHATGDSEWLYNISDRPVFGPIGAVLLFAGLILVLWRWRQPAYGFLLLWLVAGLSPAFITLPPASLGHTILIQPAVYILVAFPLVELASWLASRGVAMAKPLPAICNLQSAFCFLLAAILLLSNAARDLHDYFVVWPQEEMVRFLYRADYRDAARYLDDHPEVVDVAVGSVLMGQWDRRALMTDLEREDARVRMFNPEWALLLPAGPDPAVMPTTFPVLDPAFAAMAGGAVVSWGSGLELYRPPADLLLPGGDLSVAFANGLELTGAMWPEGEPVPGQEATLWLSWRVVDPIDLPPIPIVANPPPPGVYSGPRLEVFTHLLAVDGSLVAGDDALWVDPATLVPGDRFVQIHRFAVSSDAGPGPYVLEVGLYDPFTSERWAVLDAAGQPAADYLLIPCGEAGQ